MWNRVSDIQTKKNTEPKKRKDGGRREGVIRKIN